MKEHSVVIERIFKLFLEWYLVQQLKESIAEFIPSWAEDVALFVELLIQHQLKPALARIDCKNLSHYATKPVLRFLTSLMLGAGLLVWSIPLYIMFANVLLVGWDAVAISSYYEFLSYSISAGFFFVAPALIAKLRMPQLEQWADSVWGPSSQKDIGFCNRQLLILKVGTVFSFACPTFVLVIGRFYGQ